MIKSAPFFRTRKANSEDYGFAVNLFRDTQKPLLSKLGAWDEKENMSKFEREFNLNDVSIICLDNVDIGWLQLSESDGHIEIAQIHLEKGYRGRGIGTKLIMDLIKDAQASGKSVTLAVVQNNPALELYKRCGFRFVDKDDSKFYMRCDTGPVSRS